MITSDDSIDLEPFIDEVITLLKSNLVCNLKIISFIKRNSANLKSKFRFEPDVAFAAWLDEQTIFFFAIQTPSTDFIQHVFHKDKDIKFQASSTSLKYLKFEKEIIKTSLIMECDKSCYNRPDTKKHENISTMMIIDQQDNLDEVFLMIEAFSKELSLDISKNHYKDLLHRGTVFIGKIDDTIAGCVFLTYSEDNISRITYFYTKPIYRGMGIAKLMLSNALEYAFNSSSSKCILYVNSINHSAKSLYLSLGFRIADEFHTFLYQ